MATKIRLQRNGRKRNAIYQIVAVDSRVKRDGKVIERIGQYNPNVHPAAVKLDFDRALYWVGVGAELSDTAKSILSKEGVLLRNHLNGGVRKGAFDEKAADAKFKTWIEEKEKASAKSAKAEEDKAEKDAKDRLAAETKIKEERAAAIAAKNSEIAAAEAAAEAEANAEEAPAEEAAAEEAPAAEVTEEAPAEEVKEEAPAEEVEAAPEAEAKAEEPVAEEAPAEEAPAEEAPAAAEDKKEEAAE